MNVKQRGVVLLLKSALTGEPGVLPDGFDMDWAEELARSHHMGALVYEGALRCGVSPQTPVMQRLFQHYCKALQVSKRQMGALDRVFAAFDENGIDYLPVKGAILKRLYPKPELRTMGDADVLIRREQYDRIVPIMEAAGFRATDESEHDYLWESAALKIELHKCLFTETHHLYPSYYGDGWPLARRGEGGCHAMSPEDAFVYLFAHFAKHYRNSGIGCRHLADLWVYLKAHPALDEEYVQSVLDRLCLGRFYCNTRKTIAAWFEDGEEDDVTRTITEVIFASGSWGTAQQAALSAGVRDDQKSSQLLGSRWGYVIRRVFPGRDFLRMRYPILNRMPFLLPGVWVVHLFKRAVLSRGVLKRQMHSISALSKENVDTYRQMLDLVGLEKYY